MSERTTDPRADCPWKCQPNHPGCLCAEPEPTHQCDECATTRTAGCTNTPCHARPLAEHRPMSPETRKALAEALRGATVETLREDAEYLTRLAMVRYEGPDTFSRLSALALAVATMQERGYGVDAANYGDDRPAVWFDTNNPPDEDSAITTLPAALAALVEAP